jgi:hypothetical protein
MDFKNLKKKICEPKVSRLLPNVCDFQKENRTLAGLANGILFFVISYSENTTASQPIWFSLYE